MVAAAQDGAPPAGFGKECPGSVPAVEGDPLCGCGRGPVRYRVVSRETGACSGFCCRACACSGLLRLEASAAEMLDGDLALARLEEVLSW